MKTEDFPKETNSPPYKNMFLEGRDKGEKKPQVEGSGKERAELAQFSAPDQQLTDTQISFLG